MNKEEQQENYDAAMQEEWNSLSEREQAEIHSKMRRNKEEVHNCYLCGKETDVKSQLRIAVPLGRYAANTYGGHICYSCRSEKKLGDLYEKAMQNEIGKSDLKATRHNKKEDFK